MDQDLRGFSLWSLALSLWPVGTWKELTVEQTWPLVTVKAKKRKSSWGPSGLSCSSGGLNSFQEASSYNGPHTS